MSFACSKSITSETEDFPASSITINVSNACTVTGTSSSNPDTDNLSVHDLSDGSEEPQVKKRKAYSMKKSRTSWIWDHFNKMEEKKAVALCKICGDEVYYSKDYSTSMSSMLGGNISKCTRIIWKLKLRPVLHLKIKQVVVSN